MIEPGEGGRGGRERDERRGGREGGRDVRRGGREESGVERYMCTYTVHFPAA